MKNGLDDDSILDQLLNELDLDSAVNRLKRVGFHIVSNPSPKQRYYHLSRTTRNEHEDILIEINRQKQFHVRYMCDGLMSTYPDVIATWDDWVEFVRMLKHLLQKRPASQRDLCKDDDIDAKRVKCSE
jgi:hypothetical protein